MKGDHVRAVAARQGGSYALHCIPFVFVMLLLLGQWACDSEDYPPGSDAQPVVQGATSQQTESATSDSPIAIEPKVLDFGKVQPGLTLKGSIEITNVSSEPVNITEVKSGCGCTVADVPRSPIAPETTHTMSVQYRPPGQIGATASRQLHVVLEKADPVHFRVTAEIAEFVSVSPKRLNAEATNPVRLQLKALDGRPFSIISSEPKWLEALYDDGARMNHEFMIDPVRQRADTLPRAFVFNIDHPKVSRIRVPLNRSNQAGTSSNVSGAPADQPETSESRLKITPRRIGFGVISTNSPSVQTILVQGVDGPSELSTDDVQAFCQSGSLKAEVVDRRATDTGMLLQIGLTAVTELQDRTRTLVFVRIGDHTGTFIAYGD